MGKEEADLVQPFMTPEFKAVWLRSDAVGGIDAFWLTVGTYPSQQRRPCFRITPGVLGKFCKAIEQLFARATTPDERREVGSAVPKMEPLFAWVGAKYGVDALEHGLENPTPPTLPTISEAESAALDRAINADEYASIDMQRYVDQVTGRAKADQDGPAVYVPTAASSRRQMKRQATTKRPQTPPSKPADASPSIW
jgi:hypothetical protein